MSELLLEIYSEEIPARMQLQAQADFKDLWAKGLAEKNAQFRAIDAYVGPQRLVVCVTDLAPKTQGTTEIRRGPKVGAPDAALAGFLKSTGKTKDQLTEKDGYWYAELVEQGRPIQDLLPEILDDVTGKMPWPKTMRWYNHQTKGMSKPWIRPIHSILCVYNQKPVTFNVPGFGVDASCTTRGHRFLAPSVLTVTSFADYKEQLEKSFVILDHLDRQKIIKDLISKEAASKDLCLKEDQNLLEEVAGLVDFPFVHLGVIEDRFMDLPSVVLSTSMRVHQKYFTITDKSGQIAPFFGLVTNVPAKPDNRLMLDGFERVLRARLSDAKFFYEVDLKRKLESNRSRLLNVVFHEKLGSLQQKVFRLEQLMLTENEKRAAALCKCDLLTEMVGEFPELQGIMGEIYARADGEKPEVAQALREYYLPQGPSDPCPTAPLSIKLGLLDKLDTLLGFIGAGLKPTGSKDPFGLRRAALGVIRLVIESGLVEEDIEFSLTNIKNQYGNHPLSSSAINDTLQFIYDRLGVYLRGQGIEHDCVEAVLSGQSPNLWSIAERAKALQMFLNTEAGISLKAAYKRAAGILSKGVQGGAVNPDLLMETEEKDLFQELEKVRQSYQGLLEKHRYQDLMTLLSCLRSPIDAFFDRVTVNSEDSAVKENRYALLMGFVRFIGDVADFSKLQG